jgi:hypothetical protein
MIPRFVPALLALIVVTAPVLACEGSKVLFQDDFTEQDDAWDGKAPVFTIEGGKALFSPDLAVGSRVLHRGTVFDQAIFA